MTPSQSYLFPSDLTQQADRVSFGGLAENSWTGRSEPEWIKWLSRKKSQMASKEGGLMKCLGQRLGAFWGDCKKKGRWGDHVWNLQESTMMGDARHTGTCPELSQEQAPSLKQLTKNLTLNLNLTFSQNFYWNFLVVGYLSTLPLPCQSRQWF